MEKKLMKALTFSSFGSADVLEYQEIPMPELKENEVLVQNEAIGLNYADIYRRKGNYHLMGEPPYIAGYEGAGLVVASKSDIYKVGDKIAYADVPYANAEFIVIPEYQGIPIPSGFDSRLAASCLLQGLTAHYLANDSHNVQKEEWVFVHAASGGVGQILTQICKSKGAKVIGATRSADKLDVIRECGADYAILLNEDWKQQVMKITDDKGVDVVFDSVGSTLAGSFEITKDCGRVIFYGMSGGDPVPVDPRMLMDSSKTLSGGDLWSYLTNREQRLIRSGELFKLIQSGKVKLRKPVEFKLSEGRKAHEFLESGKSASKILLIPEFLG